MKGEVLSFFMVFALVILSSAQTPDQNFTKALTGVYSPMTRVHQPEVYDQPWQLKAEAFAQQLKNSSAKIAADENDSLALVAFYNATGGSNWSQKWDLTKPVSTWFGVSLDANGRVTGLSLVSNNLQGQIPPEIGNLTALQYLNLMDNSLSGSIPPEIGNLTALQYLLLSGNQLSGTIPPEIGNLSNLLGLDLSFNQLAGTIPTEIGNLTNLQSLALSNNKLTGEIPKEIGNLTKLQTVTLSQNRLTGSIPTEIGNLTNLQNLFIAHNQITGEIPSSIGNLTNLISLDLSDNKLSGNIPAEIGNLTSLQTLYLNSNQLEGQIPQTIGNLSALTELNLSSNHLSGQIPASIGNLTNLTNLDLSINSLEGVIPAEIGNLSNVGQLNLAYNNLSGEIPASIGNLQKLTRLYLSYNNLSGRIPDTLGALSSLLVLDLSHNSLENEIPATLGDLANLEYLDLSHNKLSGSIPQNLTNLTNLTTINLSYNNLSGTIPDFSACTNLTYFNVAFNSLQGALPSGFSNLTKLYFLNISNNNLNSLPDLHNVPLYHIDFSYNNFDFGDLYTANITNRGSFLTNFTYIYAPQHNVPTTDTTINGEKIISVEVQGPHNQYKWFKNGQLIENADTNFITVSPSDKGIYHCEITDPTYTALTLYSDFVPVNTQLDTTHGVFLQDYQALLSLYQSSDGKNWKQNTNWLSDKPVSQWYGVVVSNYRVKQLILDNNNLNGQLPKDIGLLDALEQLFMPNNKITGELPAEIGNLTSLKYLDLRNNHLYGNLPAEIGNLDSLQYLNLSGNGFTGIPSQIANLHKLTYIDLSHNLFNSIPPEINNMTSLTNLILSYNKLTSLPDLSGLTSTYVDVSNNYLDFGDLEPNLAVLDNYSPQAKIGQVQHINPAKAKVVLKISTPGKNNSYQWYKNHVPIDGANADSLVIDNYNPATDSGIYYCEVKNSLVIGLTLQSYNIYVGVQPPMYDLTLTVEPAQAGQVSGNGNYAEGDTATLTATPSQGYVFTGWLQNGQLVSTDNPYNLAITENTGLTALFDKARYEIAVNINPADAGVVYGTGLYYYGDTAKLIAVPRYGYQFIDWTKDGQQISTDTIYSLTVNSDINLTANFKKIIASVNQTSLPDIQIYPNPAKDILILSIPAETTIKSLYITNLLGQKQNIKFTPFADIQTINVSALKPGIYFIQIRTASGQAINLKFLKI